MSKKTKIAAGIAAAVVVIAVAFGVGYFTNKGSDSIQSGGNASSKDEEDTNDVQYVTYDGVEYEYNSDLQTILFLGVDKKEEMQVQDNAGRGGQSDCIILFVMDKSDKSTTMLQISRNSMADVDLYDISGEYLTTEKEQIALQYAYGDGEKKSCQLTKDAVSKLMFNIPIKSYVALNIDGISSINDAIGGVEITIPQDYTGIDPMFIQGSTVTLTGEQAERYVRYRDINVTGSNGPRMERQTQFMNALMVQAKRAVGADGYNKLYSAAKPYMVTDMSVDELKALSDYEMKEEALSVPGEEVAGAEHDEFYVNDEELQKLILKVFYKSK